MNFKLRPAIKACSLARCVCLLAQHVSNGWCKTKRAQGIYIYHPNAFGKRMEYVCNYSLPHCSCNNEKERCEKHLCLFLFLALGCSYKILFLYGASLHHCFSTPALHLYFNMFYREWCMLQIFICELCSMVSYTGFIKPWCCALCLLGSVNLPTDIMSSF